MTEQLPSRWEGVEKRVPESLDDLHGPADGVLTLPPHLCWSGMREFNLDDYQDRLMCYQIVLTTGRRCDVEEFVNRGHLLSDWSDLRRLFASRLSRAWEEALPTLRPATVRRAV